MVGIVTGYSSGIGKEIATLLEKEGFEVIRLKSRLERFDEVEKEIKSILKTKEISFLVNAAGIGIFEPLQTISTKKIQKLIDIKRGYASKDYVKQVIEYGLNPPKNTKK